MTKEQILGWLDKNNRGFTQKDFELFEKFCKEITKELQEENAELKRDKQNLRADLRTARNNLQAKNTAYLLALEELNYAKSNCLFSDCDRVVNLKLQIAKLEAQIKKMKCCENCGWYYLQQHWRESQEINKSRMFHCGTCGNKRNWKLKEIKEK